MDLQTAPGLACWKLVGIPDTILGVLLKVILTVIYLP